MEYLKLIFTILWLGSVVHPGNAKIPGYNYGTLMNNYNCAGKADGCYPHPTKCSSYVVCVGQTEAYEHSCGYTSSGILLHFVPTSGPDPATSECAIPSQAGCLNTTEPPVSSTTALPISTLPTTAPPTLGECKPNECKQVGDCRSYQVCADGKWELKECGSYLFWNPDINNGYGGSCDYYQNLNKTTQDCYVNDPECIPPCEWWQTEAEKCTGIFHYRLPFDKMNPVPPAFRESVHSCPNGTSGSGTWESLIWSPERVTCDHRSNVAGC